MVNVSLHPRLLAPEQVSAEGAAGGGQQRRPAVRRPHQQRAAQPATQCVKHTTQNTRSLVWWLGGEGKGSFKLKFREKERIKKMACALGQAKPEGRVGAGRFDICLVEIHKYTPIRFPIHIPVDQFDVLCAMEGNLALIIFLERIFNNKTSILFPAVSPMVQSAKGVAQNVRDPNQAGKWRGNNQKVSATRMRASNVSHEGVYSKMGLNCSVGKLDSCPCSVNFGFDCSPDNK